MEGFVGQAKELSFYSPLVAILTILISLIYLLVSLRTQARYLSIISMLYSGFRWKVTLPGKSIPYKQR